MTGRGVAIAYAALVAALTAFAFRPGADGFNVAEGLAAVLTLPMIVPALPAIYVLGALAWNLDGSESGDPTLLVTVTFTVLMTLVALANVLLVGWLWTRLRHPAPTDTEEHA